MSILQKEIHARHMAFLDKVKEKSKNVPQPLTKEQQKFFKVNSEFIQALRPQWKKDAIEICVKRGVTLAQVIDQNRAQIVVDARQEICWHMSKNLKMSLTRIGDLIKRDNTSVLYSVREHQKVLDNERAQG